MKRITIYEKLKTGIKSKRLWLCAALFTVNSTLFTLSAQEKIINPDITYAGSPRSCVIAGINVSGVEGYEDYVLTGISGLEVGQQITVPGNAITEAVKRYWKHGLFSKVAIAADSLIGDKIYLHIHLATRPYNKLLRTEEVGA